MADVKISALPTNSSTINLGRLPYSNGNTTYSVQMNTANSANTLMVRDASGNVGANTITANLFNGDGSGLTNVPGVPTGAVLPFAGLTAPSGFLFCDGAAISRTTFGALFSVIGTTWGIGNGSTTFNLPDLRGRSSLGSGTGGGLSTRTPGQYGGAETHTLTISQIPSHTHNYYDYYASSGGQGGYRGGGGSFALTFTNNPQAYRSTEGGNGLGGGSHNNMHPFAVLNHIIKI